MAAADGAIGRRRESANSSACHELERRCSRCGYRVEGFQLRCPRCLEPIPGNSCSSCPMRKSCGS